MDDTAKLTYLIDHDQDFEYLNTQANKLTNTRWISDAEDLLLVRYHTPFLTALSLEEYVGFWKAAMFFSVAVTKLLDMAHTDDSHDPSTYKTIQNTNKIVGIYTAGGPWQRHFTSKGNGNTSLYVTVKEDLKVIDMASHKDFSGIISIIMLSPVILFDPKSMTTNVKYLDAKIKVEIEDDDNHVHYQEYLTLGKLSMNVLLGIIDRAGLV